MNLSRTEWFKMSKYSELSEWKATKTLQPSKYIVTQSHLVYSFLCLKIPETSTEYSPLHLKTGVYVYRRNVQSFALHCQHFLLYFVRVSPWKHLITYSRYVISRDEAVMWAKHESEVIVPRVFSEAACNWLTQSA